MLRFVVAMVFMSTVWIPQLRGDESPESYAIAAKQLHESGDLVGAKLGYDKAISLAQDRPAYYYERARVKMDMGRIRYAIVDLEVAVAFDDRFADAWQLVGIANYLIGHYAEAHRCLYLSIIIDKENAKSWLWCAIVSQKLGDDNAALDFVRKTIELDENNALAWYHYGLSLSAQGKPILAADKLTKSIELDPKDPTVYYARAMAYLQQAFSNEVDADSFYEAAAKDMTTAEEMQPGLIDRNSGRALLAYMKGDQGEAALLLKKDINQADPQFRHALHLRLWGVLKLAKEDQSAAEILRSDTLGLGRESSLLVACLRGATSEEELGQDVQDIGLLVERWFCLGIDKFHKDRKSAIMRLELCSLRQNTFEAILAAMLLRQQSPKAK